jgi:SulP family sulfate permease
LFPRDLWPARYTSADLRKDLLGGLMAAFVLFPLSIGYGLISGLGAVAGLYGGIALSLVGAVCGGVAAVVRGPNILIATAMAFLVAEYATSTAEAFTIVVLAGLFQIGFGILRLGRYVAFVPHPLLAGLFTSLAITLIVSQLHVLLGAELVPSGVAAAIVSLPQAVRGAQLPSVALSAICFALVPLWRGRLAAAVPVTIMMLVAGFAAGMFLFPETATIGAVQTGLPRFIPPALAPAYVTRILPSAFVLALLSAVMILVLAFLVDSLTGSRHLPNRELVGVGLGNVAAGLLGGMPGSVSTGTLTNIRTGGRTPVSGATVGAVFLLVILVPGSAVVIEQTPRVVIAAVIVVAGFAALDMQFLRGIAKVARHDALIFTGTLLAALFIDFVSAVLIGFVLSSLVTYMQTQRFEAARLRSVPVLDRVVFGDAPGIDPFGARTGLVAFPEQVTIASARELSRIVSPDIRHHRLLLFDLSNTQFVDLTAAVVISQLVNAALAGGRKTIVVVGMRPEVRRTFDALKLLARVPPDHLVPDLTAGYDMIRSMVSEV